MFEIKVLNKIYNGINLQKFELKQLSVDPQNLKFLN